MTSYVCVCVLSRPSYPPRQPLIFPTDHWLRIMSWLHRGGIIKTKLWKHASTRVSIELTELTTDIHLHTSLVSLASRSWSHPPSCCLDSVTSTWVIRRRDKHSHSHTYTHTLHYVHAWASYICDAFWVYICYPLLLIIWYMLHSLCCLLTCIYTFRHL